MTNSLSELEDRKRTLEYMLETYKLQSRTRTIINGKLGYINSRIDHLKSN
jgi:hypothetical protein